MAGRPPIPSSLYVVLNRPDFLNIAAARRILSTPGWSHAWRTWLMPERETDVACVAHTQDVLGEVPIWSARDQALYWIDAFKPALHRFDPVTGQVQSWTP